jgi:hypothetical protein
MNFPVKISLILYIMFKVLQSLDHKYFLERFDRSNNLSNGERLNENSLNKRKPSLYHIPHGESKNETFNPAAKKECISKKINFQWIIAT